MQILDRAQVPALVLVLRLEQAPERGLVLILVPAQVPVREPALTLAPALDPALDLVPVSIQARVLELALDQTRVPVPQRELAPQRSRMKARVFQPAPA